MLTIKEELQQKINDKKEERQWVIDLMRTKEKDARKHLKIANKLAEEVANNKKIIDDNDIQIKKLQDILNQL